MTPQIEPRDIPKIKEVLQIVFFDSEYQAIRRLGGLTNRSYKIIRKNGMEYVVRIPGEGTENLINRRDERTSTKLGCKLNIDSELLYFGDDGTKVMKFISNSQPMSAQVLQKQEIIKQAAGIFK